MFHGLWRVLHSAGKDQLGGQLRGTRTWIGTTECAALLRCFGLQAKIVDFEVQSVVLVGTCTGFDTITSRRTVAAAWKR